MKKTKRKPPLNVIGAAVAGLGVPGLILAIAMAIAVSAGLTGAAVITAALAAIGLGGGMLGGIAVLGVAGLIATGFAIYGTEAVLKAALKELKKKGYTKEQLLDKIEKYWISRGLKLKIMEYVNNLWE
jgi:hypothetical protein